MIDELLSRLIDLENQFSDLCEQLKTEIDHQCTAPKAEQLMKRVDDSESVVVREFGEIHRTFSRD